MRLKPVRVRVRVRVEVLGFSYSVGFALEDVLLGYG
jgi:hypothetical protein